MNLPRVATHRFVRWSNFKSTGFNLNGIGRNSFHVFNNNSAGIITSSPLSWLNTSVQTPPKKSVMPSRISNQLLHLNARLIHTSGSNDNDVQQREKMLPQLMQFPHIVWPKFINAIRNWFFINFIIKPYFDKEFSMNEFILGVREAVSVISTKLSEGKLDELEGLVDQSAISQLKSSISSFTVFQQQLLRVASEDIFFAFPYQIGIIIPDQAPPPPSDRFVEGSQPRPQIRQVEITVCLHVLRGLAEKQRQGETGTSFNFHEFSQDERNKYNVMICNYRFFKDFTEGCPDPSWIVNMVNHFLPAEVNR